MSISFLGLPFWLSSRRDRFFGDAVDMWTPDDIVVRMTRAIVARQSKWRPTRWKICDTAGEIVLVRQILTHVDRKASTLIPHDLEAALALRRPCPGFVRPACAWVGHLLRHQPESVDFGFRIGSKVHRRTSFTARETNRGSRQLQARRVNVSPSSAFMARDMAAGRNFGPKAEAPHDAAERQRS